jgi:hypothetical protein
LPRRSGGTDFFSWGYFVHKRKVGNSNKNP